MLSIDGSVRVYLAPGVTDMQIPDDPGHGFHVIPAGDSI